MEGSDPVSSPVPGPHKIQNKFMSTHGKEMTFKRMSYMSACTWMLVTLMQIIA